MDNFNGKAITFRVLACGDTIFASTTNFNSNVRLKINKKFENKTLILKEPSGKTHLAIYCEARSKAFFDRDPDSTKFPRSVVGLDKGRPLIVTLLQLGDTLAIQRGTSIYNAVKDPEYPWYHIGAFLSPVLDD